MSRLWTERELTILKHLCASLRSVPAIVERFNATRGCNRTFHGIRSQIYVHRLQYGDRRFIPWDPEEMRLVKDMAGKYVVAEIRQALVDECGMHRTDNAIRSYLNKLERSAWPDRSAYLTTGDVAKVLGMSLSGVIFRINRGEMHPTVFGTEKCRRFRIRPAALEHFVDCNFLILEPDRMAPGPMRQRVELRRREGRYLTTEQASEISGAHRLTVNTACLTGALPAERARPLGTNGTPRWWIRASDLARWRNQRELRGAA